MKVGRHMLFWLVYCSYFYIQSISPKSLQEFSAAITYRNAFVSLCCFMPVCVMCVYVSISFIFPRYIERKKYMHAIIAFITLFSLGTLVNYFAAITYYNISGWHSKGPLLLGYLNAVLAMIISGFAIGIKAVRKYYREQKEVAYLMQAKTRNELNLQKNRMHPEFLYSSLNKIHNSLVKEEMSSSTMLLSLSNMLSYSLYESDHDLITLQQEIAAVEDFIFFQNQHDQQITLTVEENLDVDGLVVPPMIIFSSLQNNFLMIRNSDISDCKTFITIRSTTNELIVNFRFKGDCVDKNLVAPVNIRVPLKYADRKIDMTYDPA